MMRFFVCALVCLFFGQLASYGLENWGMFGHLPGLMIGTVLLYRLIPGGRTGSDRMEA